MDKLFLVNILEHLGTFQFYLVSLGVVSLWVFQRGTHPSPARRVDRSLEARTGLVRVSCSETTESRLFGRSKAQ